jgi:hypothetical protein
MMKDNGGSRSGMERRLFDYTESIPERRSGSDRRNGVDRRYGLGEHREHQNPDDLQPIERRDQFRRVKKAGVQKESYTGSGLEASD